MKVKIYTVLVMLLLMVGLLLSACGQGVPSGTSPDADQDADDSEPFQYPETGKDFSTLKTPGSQEAAYEYRSFFLPAVDGIGQPYVGDPMPYYEDGVYYIYYLKEGGDSFNHSIYLTTTTDFVQYTEQDAPVLEASRSGGQDSWTGTGSVVKVNGKYLFFYTGHTNAADMECKEKILVATGDSLLAFEKLADWELTPPAGLGQKNDFRDPQAYYDERTNTISLTVTASQGGVARILKFTLSADLQNAQYDGIILTDPTGDFWNLECSDTFLLGDKWYITYSGQDDTLWYAASDSRFGPYSEPIRLEGKLFYAAKHVEDGECSYMIGWARRSESPSSTQDVAAWGGNLMVQKLVQKADGTLALAPAGPILEKFSVRRELPLGSAGTSIEAGSAYSYMDAFTCYERFAVTGTFTYSGTGSFGLCFDYNGKEEKYKTISIDPEAGLLQLFFNQGGTLIAESAVQLEANREYAFAYIQEGSAGVFYIDGVAALTVRLYGVSGKPIKLFAENNTVQFSSLRQYTD